MRVVGMRHFQIWHLLFMALIAHISPKCCKSDAGSYPGQSLRNAREAGPNLVMHHSVCHTSPSPACSQSFDKLVKRCWDAGWSQLRCV